MIEGYVCLASYIGAIIMHKETSEFCTITQIDEYGLHCEGKRIGYEEYTHQFQYIGKPVTINT